MTFHLGCDERCTRPNCGAEDWDDHDDDYDPAAESQGMWIDERIRFYAENLAADELLDPAEREGVGQEQAA